MKRFIAFVLIMLVCAVFFASCEAISVNVNSPDSSTEATAEKSVAQTTSDSQITTNSGSAVTNDGTATTSNAATTANGSAATTQKPAATTERWSGWY